MSVPFAYYNEVDPFAANWLEHLIEAGEIADGIVDRRPIQEVEADEVSEFTQCHFFAGIGGWSRALRLAGWGDDRVVWTGSCPCQPFSVAGKQKGTNDDRHLWPVWGRLIAECCPPVVFGEQVASPAGRDWLAAVRAEMEALGYAVGAADLCAAGIGAPHIRQRLWFVADSRPSGLEDTASKRLEKSTGAGLQRGAKRPARASRVGDADPTRLQGRSKHRDRPRQRTVGSAGLGHWDGADWISCSDGKARPAEPGTFPLAHGVPKRVGRLRGYGNAIVPPLASEFIAAYLDIRL